MNLENKNNLRLLAICLLWACSTLVIGQQSPPAATPSLQVTLTRPVNSKGLDASGDKQVGLVEAMLRRPIMIKAVDPQGKPVPAVKMLYKIITEPDNVNNHLKIQPLLNGKTDNQGIYRARCALGDQEGLYEVIFYPQYQPGETVEVLKFSLTAKRTSWANWLLVGLFGGLAIFLFGMRVSAEGLQQTAGAKFRAAISELTKTPLSGLGLGAVATFFTQSSSAITTMLVSFVNARLMTFRQTIGIILGTAIGTTITVQLISFDIMKYSLPMVALGFFITFASKHRKKIAIGNIIMGFGLIFLGMKVMTEVIAPLQDLPFFQNAVIALSRNPEWSVLLAALFTAIVQSSGATLGVVLALARHNLLTLEQAVPLIFGATIGTCATALLASLNANWEAKRVAWAHLLFKVIGVAIFFPFIAQLAQVGEAFTKLSSYTIIPVGGAGVARQIANTYTLLMIFIGMLFLPFVTPFETLIARLFPSREEKADEVKAKYLQLQILETPSIAIGSVIRELSRMSRFVEEQMKAIARVLFDKEEVHIPFIKQRDDKVDMLQVAITRYLAHLTEQDLSKEEVEKSIGLLYIVSDLENIGDIIDKNLVPIAQKMITHNLEFSEEGQNELRQLHQKVAEDLSRVTIAITTSDTELANDVLSHKDLLTDYGRRLHLNHLRRLQEGLRETIDTSSVHLDVINYFQRIQFHIYCIAGIIAGKRKKFVSPEVE